jgi:hypothetical protein
MYSSYILVEEKNMEDQGQSNKQEQAFAIHVGCLMTHAYQCCKNSLEQDPPNKAAFNACIDEVKDLCPNTHFNTEMRKKLWTAAVAQKAISDVSGDLSW